MTLVACVVLAAGCVSTTTGKAPPEANNSDAAELNYQLGVRYYQNGNYELARDRLQLAVSLDPNLAVAYTALALTYEALGNSRLATENYRKAVAAAPRDFEIRNTYAVYLCKQRQFDEARDNFEKAASHRENDNAEVTLTNAGVCMVQKPAFELAEDFFRRALERRPGYGEALLQMCLLKYQMEDFLGSRAFLQRYLGANRATAGVLYLGAQIESKLGDERARQNYIEQLLREFPGSPEARQALNSS
ncbi:MAG: type IV pilus biogenesis/stability protein PilW [Gammaproteobacteria bacterium]|nr:type IV pilus biogenesis/stability protein PilW [Gammaproteobacteria bacterium]